MMPALSLYSSPNSATVRVDKATSEFLLGPDWTMNMEICDAVNSDHWIAKEVVKQLKKRLQHKNPRVQLLSLTLLETMVKNCGDHIHFHIAERKVLDDMIKLVKKRGDMQVRDKVLVLLDHWQEAFGGPGGKHSHYYWAYDELRRSGVQFPQRAPNYAPIVTPPPTQQLALPPPPGLGMPSNSSRRLDEAMASEDESLSLTNIKSMKNVMELLADMLLAVNPSDRMAVKDEVIVDLVDRCHTNQKKLVQMLTTTTDEILLAQGLELNDALQGLLAKHDAIASGSPLPTQAMPGSSLPAQGTRNDSPASSNHNPNDSTTEGGSNQTPNADSAVASSKATKSQALDEEEDDEFAQLARRHSKPNPLPGQAAPKSAGDDSASSSNNNAPTFSASDTSESSWSNALVLTDPVAPVQTTTSTASAAKDQDLADLLSIVLSTSYTSEEAQQTPNSAPPPLSYSENNVPPAANTYVAPWAQPQPQPLHQPGASYYYSQPHNQPQMQSQSQPQPHGYSSYYSYGYPPPPWAATPGYINGNATPTMAQDGYFPAHGTNHNVSASNQGSSSYPFQSPDKSGNQQLHSDGQTSMNTSPPSAEIRSLQQYPTSFHNPQSSANQHGYSTSETPMHYSSPSSRPSTNTMQRTSSLPAAGGNNGGGSVALNGEIARNNPAASTASTSTSAGQKSYVPSYRLFEDLNVFGSSEGKIKSGPYSSASGNNNQGMVGGRR